MKQLTFGNNLKEHNYQDIFNRGVKKFSENPNGCSESVKALMKSHFHGDLTISYSNCDEEDKIIAYDPYKQVTACFSWKHQDLGPNRVYRGQKPGVDTGSCRLLVRKGKYRREEMTPRKAYANGQKPVFYEFKNFNFNQ